MKTAQKGKKLANLDSNIKCGNSLIDDKDIAGDKAFVWEEEFKEIFQNKSYTFNNGEVNVSNKGACSLVEKNEQNKKAFHITWVTHNSRTSERMVEYNVQRWEWLILEDEQ